jgi:2-polyprenyl-6-methoxyphenol hydroxylase-like FAD-dependent oxidoreductase
MLSSKPVIEINPSGLTGKVTLIGDGAHPMSPIGGSGADTAIESAIDLAVTISANGGSKKVWEDSKREWR